MPSKFTPDRFNPAGVSKGVQLPAGAIPSNPMFVMLPAADSQAVLSVNRAGLWARAVPATRQQYAAAIAHARARPALQAARRPKAGPCASRCDIATLLVK